MFEFFGLLHKSFSRECFTNPKVKLTLKILSFTTLKTYTPIFIIYYINSIYISMFKAFAMQRAVLIGSTIASAFRYIT